MVGLVPPIVVFCSLVVELLSPSLFVVVLLLLPALLSSFLLVVGRLPVVPCCSVLTLVLVCWVVLSFGFRALLAIPSVVLLFISILLVMLVKTSLFLFLKSSISH